MHVTKPTSGLLPLLVASTLPGLAPLAARDEARLSLAELIELSDGIAGGPAREVAGGEFELTVRAHLQGRRLPGALRFRNSQESRCPEPARFRAGCWALCFLHGREVPTEQHKIEFATETEFRSYCERVRGYRDGSILPQVMRELRAKEGPGLPFTEKDRLRTDVIALLRKTRNVTRLFAFAEEWKGQHESLQALETLAQLEDKKVAVLLRRVRRDPSWSATARLIAIRCAGRFGMAFLEDEVAKLVSDEQQPFALRDAAVQAVRDARDSRQRAALTRIWREVKDEEKGPEPSDGLPACGASLLKRHALEALGACGGPEQRVLLEQVVLEGSEYYGYPGHAARGLALLGDPGAVPALRRALARKDIGSYSKPMLEEALRALTR